MRFTTAIPLAARAALAALALFAAGAARAGSVELPYQVGGAFSVPTTSLREARYLATIRQQYDFSCGSAALSTLLTHHYQHQVSEAAVFEEMFERGDRDKIRAEGFSLLDMKRYLESHGFQADGFEAPLDKLESAAIPAIVLIKENGYNHFVVVKGVRDGRVLIGDPSGGTRALTRNAFHAVWDNDILFVVTNRQEQARFNLSSDWLVAPRAPIGAVVDRTGSSGVAIPKFGPGDF